MAELRLCAISGSLRSGSCHTAAAELAPVGVNIVEAGRAEIQIYNEDVKAAAFPAAVARLQQAIASADAVLIATLDYDYSRPGVLKNAIDWVSRTDPQPFANKPVSIMGASPGALGTARAQYDLRRMFVYLDAPVLNTPEVMIKAAHTRFDADGRLADQATRTFLAEQNCCRHGSSRARRRGCHRDRCVGGPRADFSGNGHAPRP